MEAVELGKVAAERAAAGEAYREFMRSADLSVGLYVLRAGAVDPQQPHGEDEVYHVLSGRASITVGDETRPVRAGSVVFVAARVPHRFHDIEEELSALVVFGPPEGTRG